MCTRRQDCEGKRHEPGEPEERDNHVRAVPDGAAAAVVSHGTRTTSDPASAWR